MKSIYRRIIKKSAILTGSLSVAALLALVPGCASTKQTEGLLSAAGFKTHPATTPQQQAHLKSLPAHKVSAVQKDGKTYYVFPDVARNVLYVGQSTEYEQYKKLRRQQDLAEEQLNPAEEMQLQSALWGW